MIAGALRFVEVVTAVLLVVVLVRLFVRLFAPSWWDTDDRRRDLIRLERDRL